MDLTNRITAVLDEQGLPAQPGRGLSEPSQPRTTSPAPALAHNTPPPPQAPGRASQAPALAPQAATKASNLLSDPELLDDLLHDYLEGVKLHEIARNHLLDLADLVAVLESPPVVRLLEDLTRHAQLQSERLTTLARPVAIAKLKNLVETDPAHHRLLPPNSEIASRETTRKSAAQLERISKPPKAKSTVPPVRASVAPPPVGCRGLSESSSEGHAMTACRGLSESSREGHAAAPAQTGTPDAHPARSAPPPSPCQNRESSLCSPTLAPGYARQFERGGEPCRRRRAMHLHPSCPRVPAQVKSQYMCSSAADRGERKESI